MLKCNMDEIIKLKIIVQHQHATEYSSSGRGVEVGHVKSHLYNSIG